jgi:hypothetical protein
VLAMLIAAALLMTTTSTGGGHWLARAGKLAEVYGAYVWANLALTAALGLVLWRQRHAAGQSPVPTPAAAVRVGRLRTRARAQWPVPDAATVEMGQHSA